MRLTLFAACLLFFALSCEDDDNYPVDNIGCEIDRLAENCQPTSELTASEYFEKLVGVWRATRIGIPGQAGLPDSCNQIAYDNQVLFSYGTDSTFVVNFPDGTEESGTYSLTTLCPTTSTCYVQLDYSQNVTYRPRFHEFCGIQNAFSDNRLDFNGTFLYYVKTIR